MSVIGCHICIILTGSWCDTVLNVHAPADDESDDTNDSFHKELVCAYSINSLSIT
jgi:hypothetical protein